MVKVTNGKCNQAQDQDILDGHRFGERNWHNTYNSSMLLKDATAQALTNGYFPIVFGGDHS